MSLDQRLRRLEAQKGTGAGRLYVLAGAGEFDAVEFLRGCGHEPGPRDLVVRITRFADAAPMLISTKSL